jgi:hypothetical protein
MQRKTWWLAAITAATFILAALILTDALPYLRGPAPETSEWYWPYFLRPVANWWAPFGAALLMLVATAWWLHDTTRKQWVTITAVLLLILTSILLQLGIIYAHNPAVFPELFDRTLSNLASGFFEAAAETEDINALLSTYPEAMPAFTSDHARTHPPGLILSNWLTIQLFEQMPGLSDRIAPTVWAARCIDLWLLNRPAAVAAALATWAVLPILAAAISVWPAYLYAKQLLPFPAAKLAATLVAAIPSLLLFAPKSVQLYAPLGLFLLWAFHLALKKWSIHWFIFAGLIFSTTTFLSIGNFSLGLLLLVYALLTIWQQKAWQQVGWPAILWRGALFGLAAFSIWLVAWLVWGVAPWRIWQTGLEQHYSLVTHQRRYAWWLFWNWVDVLVYAGLPVFVGYVAGVIGAFKNGRSRHFQSINILALSLLVLLIFLNFSGSARGEVGRIWLFFLPLLALVAAGFWQEKFAQWKTAVLLVALQLLVAVSLGIAWQPVRAVIVVAQEPAMPANLAPKVSAQIDFQEMDTRPATLTLTGYTVNPQGQDLDVTLFWKVDRKAKRPFTVFVQLLDENNQLLAQQDNWPVNGQWPPTCWQPHSLIIDTYHLNLPADLPPGSYKLITGWYDVATGNRLFTSDGLDFATLESIPLPN